MKTGERVSVAELQGTEIFAGLSDDNLELIAEWCSQCICEAGEYCAVMGDTTDELLIINWGKVAIEMQVEVAPYTHTVTITTLTKGRVCAWSAIVPPHVLTASIKCIERTQMISVRASDLQRVFEGRPSVESIVMKNLAQVISSRLRDSRIQLIRLVAEVMKQGK